MTDLGSQGNLAGAQGLKANADSAPAAAETSDIRKNFNYPLVKYCDMSEEMRTEAVDTVVSAVEKHSTNYEVSHFCTLTFVVRETARFQTFSNKLQPPFLLSWQCLTRPLQK